MKYRFYGLVILAISVGMGYISFLEPLSQAYSGKSSILDGSKVITLLPLSVVLAVGLLGGGKSFFTLISNENGTKFKVAGWFIFAIGLAIGFLMAFWYEDILRGLGYRRAW